MELLILLFVIIRGDGFEKARSTKGGGSWVAKTSFSNAE